MKRKEDTDLRHLLDAGKVPRVHTWCLIASRFQCSPDSGSHANDIQESAELAGNPTSLAGDDGSIRIYGGGRGS
jgi:hypothetical protein